MNAYGDTCPLCCGDLDDAEQNLRAGAAVCHFCGCHTEAPGLTQSMARQPDVAAFSVGAMSMSGPAIGQALPGQSSPSYDSQIPAGASMELPK